MIPLKRLPISTTAQSDLSTWQREIDSIPNYRERLLIGRKRYQSRNTAGNAAFDDVKRVLDHMCHGARRCGYCEDSAANQIDHIWPQSVYPDRIFVWENYLYSCGPCNLAKHNNFAIYTTADGRRLVVTPKKQGRHAPAPPGMPLLIDPCTENPFDFIMLDMTPGVFAYAPLATRRSRDYYRAVYTIKLLGLNDRPYLPSARETAYAAYKSFLGNYIRCRNADQAQQELDHIVRELQQQPHPTVWYEMKRQYGWYPDLTALFRELPSEALDW